MRLQGEQCGQVGKIVYKIKEVKQDYAQVLILGVLCAMIMMSVEMQYAQADRIRELEAVLKAHMTEVHHTKNEVLEAIKWKRDCKDRCWQEF